MTAKLASNHIYVKQDSDHANVNNEKTRVCVLKTYLPHLISTATFVNSFF